MTYSKEEREKAFDLEQKYRDYLSDKYTAYMSYANGHELMLLAKLVDIRYNDYPKQYAPNLSVKDVFIELEGLLS